MFSVFQSELNVYYKLFDKENEKAIASLNYLAVVANQIKNYAVSAEIDDLPSNVKLLHSFGKVLQRFNHDVEIIISQFDKGIVNQIASDKSDGGNDNGYLLVKTASFIPKFYLSMYNVGYQSECLMSFVKDLVNNLCFIVDVSRSRSIDFRDEISSQIEGLPEYGIIFAVQINLKYLRAVRTHAEPTLVAFQAVLIDIGEIIPVSTHCTLRFELSQNAKLLPPMAILCFVEKFNEIPLKCLERAVGKKQFRFKINKIRSNMLQIELYSKVDDTEKNNQNLLNIMRYNAMSPNTLLSAEQNDLAISTNPFIKHTQLSDFVNVIKTSPNDNKCALLPRDNIVKTLQTIKSVDAPNITKVETIESKWFTKTITNTNIPIKQRNTNNCSPQPEKPKHFNNFNRNDSGDKPKNNQSQCTKSENSICLYGAHAKKNDESSNVDNQLGEPAVGDVLDVLPLSVVSVEEFYVQIASQSWHLSEFQSQLNQPTMNFKPIERLPEPGDFVLARYDVDELLYRARVIRILDNTRATVIYIDYGNVETIFIEQMYQWDQICNSLSIQALACKLANVCKRQDLDYDAIDYMRQKILNKNMTATVVKKVKNFLYVRLIDQEGFDVGEGLCANNLAIMFA